VKDFRVPPNEPGISFCEVRGQSLLPIAWHTTEAKPYSSGQIVSSEGFDYRNNGRCSNAHCLTDGVHPMDLWSILWRSKHPEAIRFNSVQQAGRNRFNSNHLETTKFHSFQ